MPKRTRDYHSWLLKQLEDPEWAVNYLEAASKDSFEMFLKAFRNVAEAHRMTKEGGKVKVTRRA